MEKGLESADVLSDPFEQVVFLGVLIIFGQSTLPSQCVVEVVEILSRHANQMSNVVCLKESWDDLVGTSVIVSDRHGDQRRQRTMHDVAVVECLPASPCSPQWFVDLCSACCAILGRGGRVVVARSEL